MRARAAAGTKSSAPTRPEPASTPTPPPRRSTPSPPPALVPLDRLHAHRAPYVLQLLGDPLPHRGEPARDGERACVAQELGTLGQQSCHLGVLDEVQRGHLLVEIAVPGRGVSGAER